MGGPSIHLPVDECHMDYFFAKKMVERTNELTELPKKKITYVANESWCNSSGTVSDHISYLKRQFRYWLRDIRSNLRRAEIMRQVLEYAEQAGTIKKESFDEFCKERIAARYKELKTIKDSTLDGSILKTRMDHVKNYSDVYYVPRYFRRRKILFAGQRPEVSI